ncbi:type IV pilus assembly protein FimV [Variovorax saccharolyticus]|uniref:type IV pilus assembly protein FimV n=1 Tax=Variovorax saccharolyticus TaxID=3053516 RepID=UPI00257806D0|nr:hypothetical protein [Variovorax sp. J22R187]MDM0016930.1 hypothetical protein [Variovorax sp. J22R187]
MTIGRPQGAVWIGKPMDVVIPLSLDAAEAGDSLCLQADVLQGDSAIPDRRVTVSLETGSGGSRARIRSTVPIEEPVVTLTLRAGCDLKSIRNYVLLADVPVDAALPAVPASAARQMPEAAPAPRPVARPVARAAAGDGGASGQDGGVSPPPARRSNPPASRAQPATDAPSAPRRAAVDAAATRRAAALPAPAPAARATSPASQAAVPDAPREAGAGRPRLQVEALEPAPALAGNLKATPELTLPDAPDPVRRAAAAALWSALDPAAEEAQREAKRNKDMEATLTALREQAAQNQRTLLEMRTELAQARESRYFNPLVYALVALLLLALIGMFMLWRLARRATAPAWWGEAPAGGGDPRRPRPDAGLLDDDLDLDTEPPRTRARRGGPTRTFAPTPFAPLDPLDGDDLDSGPHAPLPHPAQLAEGTPARSVNTEELFDVQQQSDFFLSLGQHDQAIAVLREHIAANPGTSALAYLDLLRIFHSLDREDDYADLAEEFEHAFNADVPSFAHFTDTGKGLEHYRGTLARIESLWPAPGTLALIEELVFRKPGRHDDEAFDLAAYQELLLLYSVAKEVIDPASASPAAFEPHAFADTVARDGPPTATAPPIEVEAPPPTVSDGPVLPPSIYGSIDQGMLHETVLDPDARLPSVDHPVRAEAPVSRPDLDMDLDAFDKTAYETMPTPIEPAKPPTPSNDPHVIDFDLFDPSTEAEIAPRPIIKR